MSTPARKRLMRDFKRLQQDPPAGISGAPHDNNIMLWNAVIFGPDDTPWDGGPGNTTANNCIVSSPKHHLCSKIATTHSLLKNGDAKKLSRKQHVLMTSMQLKLNVSLSITGWPGHEAKRQD